MATHSSVLAWRIPGTEEPDGLPSVGSHRVGHDWSDLAAAADNIYWNRIKHSVQFSPVAQSCPTLRDPMNRSKPGLPVHHRLPEFTQTHSRPSSQWMPSSHLILCRPLLFLPPIPPSIKVFPNESTLCMHRDIIQIASSGTQFKSISVEEALSSVQQNFCSSLGVQLPFLKVTWKNVKWRINEFVNYNPKVESPIKYIL